MGLQHFFRRLILSLIRTGMGRQKITASMVMFMLEVVKFIAIMFQHPCRGELGICHDEGTDNTFGKISGVKIAETGIHWSTAD
jgi:hypothetical protein